MRGARTTHRFGRFTSPPRRREGFERGSPKRPRSPRSASHCAARCPVCRLAPPSGDGCVGASRLARKHVSFRRLQKLDSERHGAAAAGEQSPVAAARRALVRSKDRRSRRAVAKAELDQGSVSRHDARPADPPSPDVSNRAGGSIEVVWWRARPDCVYRHGTLSKSPGSFSRRLAPQGAGFREGRARCRKTALSEQGTRGTRRRALNRRQLECLSFGEWSRTSLSRRLPRPASLRGVSVPEVRFESFAYVPLARHGWAAPVTSVGSRAHTPRDSRANPKSPQ